MIFMSVNRNDLEILNFVFQLSSAENAEAAFEAIYRLDDHLTRERRTRFLAASDGTDLSDLIKGNMPVGSCDRHKSLTRHRARKSGSRNSCPI